MLRDDLAAFATHLHFDALPASTVRAVKRLLIDHVSVTVSSPKAFGDCLLDLRSITQENGGKQESTLVGYAHKYPCSDVILANTPLAIGIDAWHIPSAMHAVGVLFPASLAVCEREKAGGRELITALVSGMEVMTRMGIALGASAVYERGFHPTSICGPVGCSVMAAKLSGLSEEKTAEAISIAAPLGAGSSVWAGSRTPTAWWFQIGRAAQSGVVAASMAELGCEGVGPVFEDPRGVLAGYSGHVDSNSLTKGLGEHYEIERILMYRLWFGPYLLTSIEALLDLLSRHDLQADDIDSITTRLPTPVIPLVGYPEYPENGLAALTSTRYALAVTSYLREKAFFSVDTSTPACMNDPKVRQLFERITIEGGSELDALFPDKLACRLTLKMKDGQSFEVRNEGPYKGDLENPLSDEDLELKFNSMARPAMGDERADRFLQGVQTLETIEDVSDIIQLIGA